MVFNKILLIAILFIACLQVSILAQDTIIPYCPMAIEEATWVIFDNEGFYSPVGYNGSYVVRIEGDSLHDGNQYKKMWVANLVHELSARPEEVQPPYIIDSLKFFGLVRDDIENRRFLGIVPTYQDTNNMDEVLIHDFGIEVGEEMRGAYKFDTTALLDTVITVFRYEKIDKLTYLLEE